jgi:hypothetical protein
VSERTYQQDFSRVFHKNITPAPRDTTRGRERESERETETERERARERERTRLLKEETEKYMEKEI